MSAYQRRTTEQWQSLIDQQVQSGLSAPQFCQQQSLGYASFVAWRKKLRTHCDESTRAQPTFIELTEPASHSSATQWVVELDLGSGMQLRISMP